jgi:glycolate oxidase iron-sulfur subunit
LPATLKNKVPAAGGAQAHRWPTRTHPRKVLMLLGCVQPAMMPNINSATARVLDAAGIQTLVADGAGCCGAIRTHLNDIDGGLADMRRNIDAWWPLVEGLTADGKVEAIVMNASGCGAAVKDYGHALAHDAAYADKARAISALTRDLSELLPDVAPRLKSRMKPRAATQPPRRLAYHPPCTLQHGQQLRGTVEEQLASLGFELEKARTDSHLCCGSAGTYSVLQPALAYQLRDRKLQALAPLDGEVIVSGNIGCIQHLQSGTPTPVRHWVEVLDEALAAG